MIVGQSGTVYTADGDRNWVFAYKPEENYKLDTLYLYYGVDDNPFTGRQLSAMFEDPSGALWAAQDDWIKIYYGDTVKAFWDVPFKQSVSSRNVRFIMDNDSNFYLCSHDAIIKYSEKYKVPDEVFNGSPIVPQSMRTPSLQALAIPGGLLLRSPAGESAFRIFDLQGRPVWAGKVEGKAFVPLRSGTWIVQSSKQVQKVVVP